MASVWPVRGQATHVHPCVAADGLPKTRIKTALAAEDAARAALAAAGAARLVDFGVKTYLPHLTTPIT